MSELTTQGGPPTIGETGPGGQLPPSSSAQCSTEFLGKVEELQNEGKISARSAELLRGKAQNELRCGRLTNDQAEQAGRVMESINDPAMVEKFLLNGGVALLAKLDGVPEHLQKRIVALVTERKIFLKTLGKALDKYHRGELGTGEEADAKLSAFLDRAEKAKSADEVERLYQKGGVSGVIQGVGAGAGNEQAANHFGVASRSAVVVAPSMVELAQQLQSVVAKLPDAFRSKSTLTAVLQQQDLENTLSALAAEVRKKKAEGENEFDSQGMWPSKQASEDLKLALQELSEIAGPGVTAPLQQLVQILNRGDQLGMDYTVDQLLALVALLRKNGVGSTEAPTAEPPRSPPGIGPTNAAAPSPQPPAGSAGKPKTPPPTR